jgi:rod shape-determining protein MreB
VIDKSVTRIENTIVQTLETCPPELASDIYYNGIHVTGGNALLRGLKERFEARIQVPVHIDYNAFFSVSKGIARILQKPGNYNHVLMA